MTWIIDSDGDLRYDAPDGRSFRVVPGYLDRPGDPLFDFTIFGVTHPEGSDAFAELVRLVKDGLRWRQMYRAATAHADQGERIDAMLAEVQEILRTADPADKNAWRLP